MQCPNCIVNVTKVDDVWHCPMCKRNWDVEYLAPCDPIVEMDKRIAVAEGGCYGPANEIRQGELLPRKEESDAKEDE